MKKYLIITILFLIISFGFNIYQFFILKSNYVVSTEDMTKNNIYLELKSYIFESNYSLDQFFDGYNFDYLEKFLLENTDNAQSKIYSVALLEGQTQGGLLSEIKNRLKSGETINEYTKSHLKEVIENVLNKKEKSYSPFGLKGQYDLELKELLEYLN